MKLRISFIKIILIVIVALLSTSVFAFWGGSDNNAIEVVDKKKEIIFSDNDLIFRINSQANTVSEFIEEQVIELGINDNISPAREVKLYSGSNVTIQRAKKITILADGKMIESYTFCKRTEDAVLENNIIVNDIDMMFSIGSSLLSDETEIEITRVNVEEKIVKKSIDYKTITQTDDELGWREEKIKQKGEEGVKEIKYKITYHNGKEISQKALESNITKDPISEIIVQGTYVKIGKSHSGQGTWYSHTGTMAAASPWLPMGSYAKVTNKANGKTVIVKINDRGPFGKGRIIDLDKVAFNKIASIGAGVINVKVEEILN